MWRFVLVPLFAALALGGGCLFPQSTSDGGSSDDGGTGGGVGYTSPTLAVTVAGVHFGPAAPGGTASLVNSRDAAGNLVSGSFRISATVAMAGCQLAFDRFGAGAGIGVGQYTINSNVGSVTPSGIVYPTGAETVTFPQGSASCTGSDCDFGALVLSQVDSDHVQGYWSGVVSDGAGQGTAEAVCSFYLPWSQYQP
jgi:hypothetical protein